MIRGISKDFTFQGWPDVLSRDLLREQGYVGSSAEALQEGPLVRESGSGIHITIPTTNW